MKSLAPIILFAYNRPVHTLKTLEALRNNSLAKNSKLIIYLDGPKGNAAPDMLARIKQVRDVAKSEKWCGEVEVIESKQNLGLFKSIVNGVTTTIQKFGRVIVLEDDVLVSKGFLEYMNNALDFYENIESVMHISAFTRPEFQELPVQQDTYFFYHTSCWGWATWERAWSLFKPDALLLKREVFKKGGINKLNMDHSFEIFWGLKAISQNKFQSWNYLWHSTVFLNNGYSLHPRKSLVQNIGHDGSGTNCEVDTRFAHGELNNHVNIEHIPIELNNIILTAYKQNQKFKTKIYFLIRHYLSYLRF